MEGSAKTEDVGDSLKGLKMHDANEEGRDLFAPPPPKPKCPICMLPLPLDIKSSTYMECCGHMICGGCDLENSFVLAKTNIGKGTVPSLYSEAMLEGSCCPFCRKPTAADDEEEVERYRERAELNDAHAIYSMGEFYLNGEKGVSKNERKGFDLFLRAAELGSLNACHILARIYRAGVLVKRDDAKVRHYLEVAALGGHVGARRDLGCFENNNGDNNMAMKNWLISAAAGDKDSLAYLGQGYRKDMISKDEYANALRAHQNSLNEEKSDERDKYTAAMQGDYNKYVATMIRAAQERSNMRKGGSRSKGKQ